MSNRRRITRGPQRYAVRAQRRSDRPARQPPAWLHPQATWLPATLAVAAEAGHLIVAYLEWQDSTTHGIYHVVAGALLGVIAAMLIARAADRVRLTAAAVVAASGPLVWLGGPLLDAPPYQQAPTLAAIGIAACEIALAGWLAYAAWQLGQPAADGAGAGRPRAAARGRAA